MRHPAALRVRQTTQYGELILNLLQRLETIRKLELVQSSRFFREPLPFLEFLLVAALPLAYALGQGNPERVKHGAYAFAGPSGWRHGIETGQEAGRSQAMKKMSAGN